MLGVAGCVAGVVALWAILALSRVCAGVRGATRPPTAAPSGRRGVAPSFAAASAATSLHLAPSAFAFAAPAFAFAAAAFAVERALA